MSSLDCTVAINAHPDIDGIGIRLATYCQLFIAIITLAIAPQHGIGSWWAVIITSLSLQVTAIVEHQDLSLYHALIVTWLTFPVFMMTFYYGILAWGRKGIVGEIVVGTVLHGSIFIGFCLWVWGTADTFGDDVVCNSHVKFSLFSLFQPTGRVRGFALFVVSIFALMMICIIIALGSYCVHSFIELISPIMNKWKKAPTPSSSSPILSPMLLDLLNHTPSLHSTVAILTTINLCSLILSICQIESMIAANAWLITPGTSDWTFGQILSIILVANPLLNFFKVVKMEYDQEESLEKRPAAKLVVNMHRKWRSARESGFSMTRARKEGSAFLETKSLRSSQGLPYVHQPMHTHAEQSSYNRDDKTEVGKVPYNKTLPPLPRTNFKGYSTLRSFDDHYFGQNGFSSNGGMSGDDYYTQYKPRSPLPSYHTLAHGDQGYTTLQSMPEVGNFPPPTSNNPDPPNTSLLSPSFETEKGDWSTSRSNRDHSQLHRDPTIIPSERYSALRLFLGSLAS